MIANIDKSDRVLKNLLICGLFLLSSAIYAQNISGSWKGILNVGENKLNLVFHFQHDANGNEICLMDSPDQNAKGIPMTIQYISADSISLSVPSLMVSYNGKLYKETIKGIFKQAGFAFKLDLQPGDVKRIRPQTPTEPFPYTSEEITFTNDSAGVTLAGTLCYPTAYRTGKPIPVVLMVSGSGGQERDCTLFDHLFFKVIADYLARHGIASLRYDDRAVGRSTGKRQAQNTLEVAQDADTGIKYLRNRNLFSKIGLLGHSEGGCVAFMLGAENKLDFAISMAGTGVKGDEILYSQTKIITETSTGQPFPLSKEDFLKKATASKNPWIDFFINYDPQNNIKKISCPVLALHGDKDMQVIAAMNVPQIETNLPKNPKSKIKVYQGLNHLFQECKTGLPTEYAKIEQTISPIVLQDIVNWIKEL